MAATAWLEAREIAEQPTVKDAWDYFGIPPDPENRLDSNINKKRRHWRGKKRAQKPSPGAEKQIDAVLTLIDFLAEMVKRGVDEPIDMDEINEVFRHKPKTTVGEIDDLWRVLEELLAAGQVEEALKVANDARTRWNESAVAHSAFGWVAAQASRTTSTATDRLRQDGVASCQFALDHGEVNPDSFWSLAVLQLDLAAGEEAKATLDRADRELPGGVSTSNLNTLYVEALVGVGDIPNAEIRAVAAVQQDPEDLAIRSSVAFALVNALRNSLLPILDADGLQRYKQVAAVAAWCAVGAPEAEDRVRPYRMWGVVADNNMYSGDVALRAFFAVVTGYLILPLLNRSRSKPQWRIIRDGPDSVGEQIFGEVVLGAIFRETHDVAKLRLPWWSDFIKAHPELQALFESERAS